MHDFSFSTGGTLSLASEAVPPNQTEKANSGYRREKSMIRRLSTFLLTIVALVSVVNIASHAESKPLLTHHVRDVTSNGQATLVGHLPANQSMRLVLVLPVRNQAGLDDFLKDIHDPFSPNYHHY